MDISRIMRFIVGVSGLMLVGVILFYVWRFYGYLYLNLKKRIDTVSGISQSQEEVPYIAPQFVYDNEKHEFHILQGHSS